LPPGFTLYDKIGFDVIELLFLQENRVPVFIIQPITLSIISHATSALGLPAHHFELPGGGVGEKYFALLCFRMAEWFHIAIIIILCVHSQLDTVDNSNRLVRFEALAYNAIYERADPTNT